MLVVYDKMAVIATGYGLDNWGVGVQVPGRSTSPRPTYLFWDPPSLLFNMKQVTLSKGVKRTKREFCHLLQTSAKHNKFCIYTSTPP
jgi:hypothetical protein